MNLKDFNKYVINPEGIKATALYFINSDDYGNYYNMTLTFHDEDLNRESQEGWWNGWRYRYSELTDDDLIAKMKRDASDNYTSVVNFHVAYNRDDIVIYWRQKYYNEFKLRISIDIEFETLKSNLLDEIEKLKSKIKELENDKTLH